MVGWINHVFFVSDCYKHVLLGWVYEIHKNVTDEWKIKHNNTICCGPVSPDANKEVVVFIWDAAEVLRDMYLTLSSV